MIALPSILPDDTARARRSDPLTSHAAADSNSAELRSEVEALILVLLREKPMTDAELTAAFFAVAGAPVTHFDSVRKRRSDLSSRGLVVPTNLTRLTPSRRAARVWGVTL